MDSVIQPLNNRALESSAPPLALTDHECEGSGVKNELLRRQNLVLDMASKNRGKLWSNDATDILIDLWSEETIQCALESSKTSEETREVYSALQVSNTL